MEKPKVKVTVEYDNGDRYLYVFEYEEEYFDWLGMPDLVNQDVPFHKLISVQLGQVAQLAEQRSRKA